MHVLADSAGTNAAVAIGWVLAIAAYWIPSFVAGGRHVPNTGSIVVINLFLGWTVVGWVVALAMAVRSQPRPQYVVPSGWQPPSDTEQLTEDR